MFPVEKGVKSLPLRDPGFNDKKIARFLSPSVYEYVGFEVSITYIAR